MRIVQVVLFVLGTVSFIAATFFTEEALGDTLWRAGVALLLIDLVCMKLWPSAKTE